MTLPDFLLARIAEDAAVATAAREHEYLSAARDASPLRWVKDSQGFGTIFANSGRMLAECEAKRRIVERHRTVDIEGNCAFCIESAPCEHLRWLALPYADHPDCRDEWKP